MSSGLVLAILGTVLKSTIFWAVSGISAFIGGGVLIYKRYQRKKYKKERDEARYKLWLYKRAQELKKKHEEDTIDPFAPVN